MVKVYFERDGKSRLVAVFINESVYKLCFSLLEKEAELNEYILTESVEDEIEFSDLIK